MRLTIEQVCHALNVPASTVTRWIRQGRIPVETAGAAPTFDKSTLERWARQSGIGFRLPDTGVDRRFTHASGSLAAAMERGGVYRNIEAKDMPSALRAAVNVLLVQTPDTLCEKLLDRENLASTGVGKGVAIPHTRMPLEGMEEEAFIATIFLKNSIDYKALDGIPVFVLFILVSPSVQTHLHLLSRLAFCVRENAFVAFLRERPGAEDLYRRIVRLEEGIGHSPR